jgi:quercetin dioxygenase-like cupin family protein
MNLKKVLSVLMATILFAGLIIGDKCMAETLTKKQQDIALISSYSAKGDLANLETVLNTALDDGLTINEIKEILVQMYAYCGFPRSLNSIGTFMKVVENRKDKNYPIGEEPKILPKDTDKFAYGDNVQVELTGDHVNGGIFDFAPAIDTYLKEHLFADIFARGVLTHQEREVATIAALSSIVGVEPQLNAHIQIGKNTGLTDENVDEILALTKTTDGGVFGMGEENVAYAKYFKGQSYLKLLTKDGVGTANVTFEPKCRNNWHIHHKGGQILLVTSGRGYYQEWGKEAQELHAGDVVNIPPETKHWHGAARDSWFTHVAIEVPAKDGTTEWLEPVSDEEYNKLK